MILGYHLVCVYVALSEEEGDHCQVPFEVQELVFFFGQIELDRLWYGHEGNVLKLGLKWYPK